MAKGVSQADVDKHVEGLVACYPEGRVEGASKIATDEIPVIKELEGGLLRGEFLRERAAVDRPVEAILVAQGQVIAEFVGRRCQRSSDDDENIQHFSLKKKGAGLAMVIEREEFILAKLQDRGLEIAQRSAAPDDQHMMMLHKEVGEVPAIRAGQLDASCVKSSKENEDDAGSGVMFSV